MPDDCQHLLRSTAQAVSTVLVQYFEDDCNQRLVEDLEGRAEELAALRTPQRVRLALRARLEMLIPFMGEPHGIMQH